MTRHFSTAVITGCAGFIGSHLVDLLLSHGMNVFGVDSLITSDLSNLKSAMNNSQFTFINADVRSPDISNRIPSPVDVVFHLAAVSSVRMSIENPLYVNDVNVNGTLNMLLLARMLGAKRFVLTSSASVYGAPSQLPVSEESQLDPLSPYAASKIAAEQYVRSFQNSFGLETTILRYFNVYGPRQKFSEYSGVISIFINRLLQSQSIIIEGDGEQTRSFIYVDDAVRATWLAAQSPLASGQVINLGSTQSVTINRLVQTLKGLVPESSSQIIYGPARVGDIRNSIASMERAKKLLDFRPTVPFEEGLARTVNWYRSHQV